MATPQEALAAGGERTVVLAGYVALFLVSCLGIGGLGYLLTDAHDVAEDRRLGKANGWAALTPVSRFALMLALLVTVVAGLLAQYRTVLGREAGVSFLLLLLGLKLLELRARRDIYVLITLCFFLLLTQFLRGQGLDVAVLVAVAVGALFFVLVSVNHGTEDAPASAKARLVGSLMLKALPLTLVLFVLFPRVQGPLWRLPGGPEAAGITGLSSSMSPGSISRLIESDEIALRASFQGSVPPPDALYWRGPVFDHYDGRTWRASQPGERLVPVTRPLVEADPASRIDYTVTLEPHRRDWLPAPDLPLAPDDVALSVIRH